MPPKIYHIVRCVRRPLNKVLKLSARERDATTPMMIRTTPTINRTTPIILLLFMVGEYYGCRIQSIVKEPPVFGVKYLTANTSPIELVPRVYHGRSAWEVR
jgi:hypothetical protein